MKRKLAFVFGLMLVLGATLLTAAGPTLAEEHDPLYLALGDSLAVGVGASDPALGYVPQLHEFLKLAEDPNMVLNNLAVNGETSTTFRFDGQLVGAASAIGLATDVQVVTLDIGGNDLLGLFFSEPCASGPFGDPCKGAVAVALGTFGGNYAAILGTLNAALALDPGEEELIVMTSVNPKEKALGSYTGGLLLP